ncbi:MULTISPECIES: DUF2845 domain-containing protein [Pseudomonas]|uniref:DUF2845 domain-containing protein n=1 Tax=Pseudomonas segetis TaxID=298908 RepID=A0A239GP84_9PSED|nr:MULTISPECIES: DUF2845 domain-containing protein [Pseudomonas]SNS70588.1 Protein of unknown function [Pseudomonas segetis]
MKRFLAASVLLSCSNLVLADSLRCGSALVTTDDTTSEVSAKCGEPVSRDFLGYKQIVDSFGYTNEVAIEEWAYGPRSGMYHFIRFEGNRLKRITSKRGN